MNEQLSLPDAVRKVLNRTNIKTKLAQQEFRKKIESQSTWDSDELKAVAKEEFTNRAKIIVNCWKEAIAGEDAEQFLNSEETIVDQVSRLLNENRFWIPQVVRGKPFYRDVDLAVALEHGSLANEMRSDIHALFTQLRSSKVKDSNAAG